MKTGDIIAGNIRVKTQNEKFSALLYVKSVNGFHPGEATGCMNFEDMTPIFPDDRIRLETGPLQRSDADYGFGIADRQGTARYDRGSAENRKDDPVEADSQGGDDKSPGYESDHSAH